MLPKVRGFFFSRFIGHLIMYFVLEKETNWSQKMASEQQLTGLNDEIENLRSEKKKWRRPHLLEEEQ